MARAKIAVTIDVKTLDKLDELVSRDFFPNRSQAVQEAVSEKIERIEKTRLERECGKLDVKLEQELADEGIEGDLASWPEY